MKDELIKFKTAKLAKEKGFDWETIYYHATYNGVYNEDDLKQGYSGSSIPKTNWNKKQDVHIDEVDLYSAPTQTLLQKWLRDTYNIHVTPDETFTYALITNIGYYPRVFKPNPQSETPFEILYFADSFCGYYEEALEEGLYNALLLL